MWQHRIKLSMLNRVAKKGRYMLNRALPVPTRVSKKEILIAIIFLII